VTTPSSLAGFVLIVTDGNAVGQEFPIVGELLFGREPGGFARLGDDPKLSRRHARIGLRPNGVLFIEDLGSANGTWVNGERISKPFPLVPGDIVKMGTTLLEVRSPRKVIDQPAPWVDGRETIFGDETSPPSVDPAPEARTAAFAQPIEQVGSPSSVRPAPPLTGATPPAALLLYAGKRVPIPHEGLAIGRLGENDIAIDSDRVSRLHARVEPGEGRHYLTDLRSINGTYLNGERLVGESRWLNSGDAIAVGGEVLRYLAGDTSEAGLGYGSAPRSRTVRPAGRRMTIGRDPANDLVLDAPNISRFHAEVITEDSAVELRDLASRNGTRLDGRVVERAHLVVGSEIGIGPFRLVFDGANFVERDDRGALRLDCHSISVAVKAGVILNRVSLSIQPGEFVAVIGESGAGKTTLIRVLAGAAHPTSGLVHVSGEPVMARLADVGYLPQDEIVHPRLTVVESLRYAARLRLPPDSSPQDIESAVQEVLAEVSLTEHGDTRLDSLSGGQRKRVGLATELLNGPGLIFLDEPTTGLDPGLEGRMMDLFRRLAAVGRRAVCVTTHATRNLDAVDKLCVMGRGGELCFFGSPSEAKQFFDVSSYDEIYRRLEDRPALDWRRAFEAQFTPAGTEDPPSSQRVVRPAPPPLSVAAQQARVLIARYLKVFVRDRRNVLILLLQVPFLALAMGLLFKPNVFAPPGLGDPANAATLLFVMALSTIWFGTLDSARELIKERAVFRREDAVGVDLRAYLASKAVVLFGLVSLQAVALYVVVLMVRHLHASEPARLGLLILLVVTGWTAVSMGLLISASVGTEDQATALIPIAMIVQLLLGGAIVTIKNMGAIKGGLAALAFSRWSFAGAGSLVDMNARIAGDVRFRQTSPYGHSFFSLSGVTAYVILLAFLVAFLVGAWFALRRQTR
jgi:ABC-type multidrug transport system ATPase subunit/pSer/pThr/pTyr-binding forkhead associated (FHA) protein